LSVRGAYEYGVESAIVMPNADVKTMNQSHTLYNIYGVRVTDAYKGIVISGGKKYIKR
jgi:hypothetical protein